MIEPDVQQAVIAHLHSEGYAVWHPRTKYDKGPDIVGYHPDRHHLWIIEAKGSAKTSLDRRMAFEAAIGQICQRGAEQWKQETGCGPLLPADVVTYGSAFPGGEEYRFFCRQFRSGIYAALSLYLFFVDSEVSPPTIIGPHTEDI